MQRPGPSEHDAYYSRYIDLVPDGDLLPILAAQMAETQTLLASVPVEREEYRYAPGKWSIREVVGHLIDTERVFAFRCLWIARAAGGELPSMDQDAWVATAGAGHRPLPELAEELGLVRRDSLAVFRSLGDEAWARTGIAGGNRISARACAWIIAGHELWHQAGLVRDYGAGSDA